MQFSLFTLLILVTGTRAMSAQTCPSWSVTGTVSSGDGSIIPVSVALYATGSHAAGNIANATANSTSVSFTLSGNVHGPWETQFFAINGYYFWSLIGGSMTCVLNPQSQCTTCSGGFGLSLYARQGAIEGTLDVIPRPLAGLAGIPVWAASTSAAFVATHTDASGHFEWRSATEPDRSNNWGVGVAANYSPWPHSGQGASDYRVGVGPTNAPADFEDITVKSSQLSTVSLTLKNPYAEEPEMRSCPSVGKPVSVVTGNVFFDQTDITLPGLTGLAFTRAYNSRNAFRNIPSAFGRGWTHSYEKTIAVPEAGALAFREGDGVPVYYQDSNGDFTYEAVLPATDNSWIVRATGGGYTRHIRKGGNETYDSMGRLLTIVDPSGNVVTLTRNGAGRLETIADAGGRSLTLSYNGASQLTSLSGPAGVVALYEYDGARLLRKVTYPDGSGYFFTYDGAGQVLRVDDQVGIPVESHTYDSSGYALTSEIADGREKLNLAYDLKLGTTTVTDALGNVTTYRWRTIAALRRVTEVTGPCSSCGGGQVTTGAWAYDKVGNITRYTNGTRNTWTYTYDPATSDLLTENTPRTPRPVRVRGQDASTHTYTYLPDGRIQTKTDPLGAVTSYTYGPAGPLTITQSVTSTQNRTTTLTYTAQGKLETILDPRVKTPTLLGYNSFGDLTGVTNPLGKVTTYGYDALGRRTSVTDPLLHATTTTYGDGVHVTKMTSHDLTHTDFTYDRGGRRTSVTDPMGRVTLYGYDGHGRLETVTTKPSATEPPNGTTTYGYDMMSNVTSITDARGKVTSFTYDGFNRVATVTYPGIQGPVESFTYDAAGRLAIRTDRKGVVTTHTYDVRGRLTRKAYSDGTRAVTYAYDKVDRLLSAANSADSLAWSYDLAGQMRSEASTRNGSALTYTYDLGGNRESVSLDRSVFLTYGYDDASQLKAITRDSTVFALDYDDASRRTSLAYANGISTTYSYDNLNRLTRLKADLGSTPITDFQYVYDDTGNRTRKEQLDYTEDYSYDALYRVSGVLRTGGLTGTWQFGYDAVGNRLTSQVNSLLSTSVYDDRNELTSTSGATTAAYSYDLNGNLTHKVEGADTWTYEWTVENQLSRVLKNGVEQSRFAYDPRGRRVEKVAGGVSTSWTYDNEDILREVRAATTLRYVHGPGIDEPLATVAGSTLSYLHADGLDSVGMTTTAAGAVTASRRYDAWGNLELGGTSSGYAFTGREWDPETGLYYYRARYYDPKIGRFISEDPIGFDGGNNFYAYALDNSVNYIDPFGLRAWVCKVPLPTFGGNGQRSGPDIWGNPAYHEYICVERNGVMTCGGQNRSGNPISSPGTPSQDTFDPANCNPIDATPCQELCFLGAFAGGRPRYGIGPQGTDCQEWVSGTRGGCGQACPTPKPPKPSPTPRPPLPRK